MKKKKRKKKEVVKKNKRDQLLFCVEQACTESGQLSEICSKDRVRAGTMLFILTFMIRAREKRGIGSVEFLLQFSILS